MSVIASDFRGPKGGLLIKVDTLPIGGIPEGSRMVRLEKGGENSTVEVQAFVRGLVFGISKAAKESEASLKKFNFYLAQSDSKEFPTRGEFTECREGKFANRYAFTDNLVCAFFERSLAYTLGQQSLQMESIDDEETVGCYPLCRRDRSRGYWLVFSKPRTRT